jgi:hypothetical protein
VVLLMALAACVAALAVPAFADARDPSVPNPPSGHDGSAHAQANIPYTPGDVFVGDGLGLIPEFHPSGTLVQTLDNTTGSAEQTGMCFDAAGNLYSTNFEDDSVSKFDGAGNLLVAHYAGPFNQDPESCVFDSSGNMYVGQADGARTILKFDSSGTLIDTLSVATGDRGSDWIDLASDQCTIYYTSEDDTVHRYDACTHTQLADFATGLPAPCFALRILANGGVLVTCLNDVVHLDSTGATIGSTTAASLGLSELFAMNLDPDGTSFWTAGFTEDKVVKADIATGNVLSSFTFSGVGESNAGLAVFGEPLASSTGALAITKTVVPPPSNATAAPPDSFVVNVTCDDGVTNVDLTFPDVAGTSAPQTVSKLHPGSTCVITEDTSGFPAGTVTTVTPAGADTTGVVIQADHTTPIDVTNDFTNVLAAIVIQPKFTG